jgi:selenocysteine-specific elongation factor
MNRRVPLLPGDRFILRESGRSETVGGGQVLDVDPQLPPTTAQPSRSLDRVVSERGWVLAEDLLRLTGEQVEPTIGSWVVSPDELSRACQRVEEQVRSAGPAGVDLASFDDKSRLIASILDTVEISDNRAMLRGLQDPLLNHPILKQLADQGCAPQPPVDVSTSDLRRLQQRGLLFERDGLWFHPLAIDQASGAARELLAVHAEGFTLSQFRDALGITRKHAVPLASELDGRGITRRRGDLRIAGPRL